jgi:hypothetical protein
VAHSWIPDWSPSDLWNLQLLLAVAFYAHGWLFLARPPDIAKLMDEALPRR